MIIGWLKDGTKWYYFATTGKMVTGTQTIDDIDYTFADDGVWIA